MRTKAVITFAFASTLSTSFAADLPRPRGVSPEYAKYYKDASSFACIFNPSITLEASQINDDFCDCPDGSDEPGTSACSHISALSPPSAAISDSTLNNTAALPGFYCKNKGHRPAYIPFTYVNDGICDYDNCCDGSDESEGIVKCEDKCKEIGTMWKKAEEQKQKTLNVAMQKRRDLVATAARLKLEVEEKISNLKSMVQADEIKIQEAENNLVETEKREKLRAITAPKTGGRLGVLVSLAKKRTEDLRAGVLKLMQEKASAEFRVKELEGILEAFKTEYNPNFNDEGVKRAVRAWEEYEARGRHPADDHVAQKEMEDLVQDDSEHGLTWDDYETADRDTDSLYLIESYLPPSARDWLRQKYADVRVFLVDNGILPAVDNDAAGESKAVQDTRTHLDSVKSERDGHQSDLTNNESDLTKNYGPDDVFRALKGECVNVESGEYTYEHCFMDKTTQKPNKGGMDTAMGYFDRIEFVNVDEGEPADGKGLGSGERIALRYENGATCWNGPARSTTVILVCYEINEVWKVVEEEKCIYRMEAGSPAACTPEGSRGASQAAGKDEL
ncbi:hypothetical protein BT63DRAFT_448904 [Microthyrium microscopicum]|uniref:Glucosidase 2 subunit beta n=1 Tax=Microthyrium microscopicum TaxID=703497 RepID=A0A6A6TT81_9PEZI|nr:hypothetical protein BT63DRAFT_448904 [Microthyrium microscopicum]